MTSQLPTNDWNFDCDKCGACCKVVGCPYITSDNRCSIYHDRPFICNTKKIFDAVHSKTMTKQEYFDISRIACNKLKKIAPIL